jgi:pristinamycin I synthase-3/4
LADHFFQLGGHSLLATRLVALVRDRLARELPISAVFQQPVLGQLAQRLQDADSGRQAWGPVLTIRPGGALPPLLCVHPVGGLCWPYFNLLPVTAADQPMHGLQAPGLLDNAQLPQDIEQLLDTLAGHALRLAAGSPARLLGWSFGGVVAHALATRLQAQGRTVERLLVFDAYPPPDPATVPVPPGWRIRGPWWDLAQGLDLAVDDTLPDDALDAAHLQRLAIEQAHPLAALSVHEINRFATVAANNTRLVAGLRLGRFVGDLVLVTARRRVAAFDATRMNPQAWQPHCSGQVRVVAVESTHNRLLAPETLAQLRFLARVDLDPGRP